MRELLLEIWTSVRRNKLRTFLTGFSVAWGIFMLVILLGSGNGLKNGVLSNFGNYATNSITISGGWTSKAYAGYNKCTGVKMKCVRSVDSRKEGEMFVPQRDKRRQPPRTAPKT